MQYLTKTLVQHDWDQLPGHDLLWCSLAPRDYVFFSKLTSHEDPELILLQKAQETEVEANWTTLWLTQNVTVHSFSSKDGLLSHSY